MEEHDGDEGMFLDGTSVGAVFKDEMQSRGPGSYPYCIMTLYADWNVCHHADASSTCRTTCTGEYTTLVESFENFKNSVESNYSHTPAGGFSWDTDSAAGKFNQIQTYYESTLSTLQVQRNEKDLLEDHLAELKSAKESLEAESESENNDPALLAEVTEQYEKTLAYVNDKQTAIKETLTEWKTYVEGHIVDTGASPCQQVDETNEDTTSLKTGTFDAMEAQWTDNSFAFRCGVGSETDANNFLTRSYCGEEMPFCCKSNTKTKNYTENGSQVTQSMGMCWHDISHANCDWETNGKSVNNHFSFDNYFLCDLRRQKKEHRELWEKLYTAFDALEAYKKCSYCSNTANAAEAYCTA